MSRLNLSETYRRLTARPSLSARALLDSDTVTRAAAGKVVPHERAEVASALAASTAHADIVRFMRALAPSSAELAQSLTHMTPAHESRERVQRVAGGARRRERGWQWGALAAVFVAAVAIVAARSSVPGLGDESVLAASRAKTDDIFTAAMDAGLVTSDLIFRDEQPDVIFNGRLGGS
jgi:hypothetical protein